MTARFIPPHGGYEQLLSFQKARIVYDGTVWFCKHYLDNNYETFKKGIENSDPSIAANVMIGLVKLTNFLLDRQIRQLEQAFAKEGGMRERMTRARLAERAKQDQPSQRSEKAKGPKGPKKLTTAQ